MSISVLGGVPVRRTDADRRTHDIERELLTCDDARATALRHELVELNMAVAESVANRYASRGIPRDDLHQVAYLALVKAAQRYDAESGHAFLSFCVPTIRGEVRRHFRDHGWMIRPPRSLQELQARVNSVRGALTGRLGHQPTADEIASELDEDPSRVREALDGQGCFTPASLDRPVGDTATASTLGELLEDDRDEEGAAEARVALGPIVHRLSPRDKRILAMRFYEEKTQREIAEDIGVTQMQVSRLLTRIFRDLRRDLGSLEAPSLDARSA